MEKTKQLQENCQPKNQTTFIIRNKIYSLPKPSKYNHRPYLRKLRPIPHHQLHQCFSNHKHRNCSLSIGHMLDSTQSQHIKEYHNMMKQLMKVLQKASRPLSLNNRQALDIQVSNNRDSIKFYLQLQHPQKYQNHLQKWKKYAGCPQSDNSSYNFAMQWQRANRFTIISAFQRYHLSFYLHQAQHNLIANKQRLLLYLIQNQWYNQNKRQSPDIKERIHLGTLYEDNDVLATFLWVTNHQIPIQNNSLKLLNGIKQLQKIIGVHRDDNYSMFLCNSMGVVQEIKVRVLMRLVKNRHRENEEFQKSRVYDI